MSEVRIVAETRTEFGKGPSRRARSAGLIPVVLYGHGGDPRHFTVGAREFSRAMKGGANTVLTLQLPTGDELALPKAVVRHPLRDYVEHVDLLLIRLGERVTVDVQIIVTGEPAPSTMVLNDQTSLSIEVEALHIPDSIEVSVEGLEAGAQILAGQVVLPAGATLASDPEALVVAVTNETEAEVEPVLDADAAAVPVAVEDAEEK